MLPTQVADTGSWKGRQVRGLRNVLPWLRGSEIDVQIGYRIKMQCVHPGEAVDVWDAGTEVGPVPRGKTLTCSGVSDTMLQQTPGDLVA